MKKKTKKEKKKKEEEEEEEKKKIFLHSCLKSKITEMAKDKEAFCYQKTKSTDKAGQKRKTGESEHESFRRSINQPFFPSHLKPKGLEFFE